MGLRLLLVGFVLVGTLVGCGDSDGSPSDDDVDAGPVDEDTGADMIDASTGDGDGDGDTPDAGGAGDGGGADAASCEALPGEVSEDLSVGPGCVSMDRTRVRNAATLTIAAGTEVRVATDGYMLVDEGATLTAIGTEAEPILFTSAADDPFPGDWQCIRFDDGSSASQLRYATLEYGGQPCDANGAKKEGILVVAASVRAITDVTLRASATHGIELEHDARAREIENVTFADNEKPSILLSASELLTLGTGLTFEDADDFIEVDTTFALQDSGHWLAQPVPFRVAAGMQIDDMAEVIMDAGITVRMTGGTFTVFNANLLIEGSEAAPVVFTSAASSPAAGDWGCLYFDTVSGSPSIDHAVFEYAGSGEGCSGARYTTAVETRPGTSITNTTFRDISGSAIRSSQDCSSRKAEWCDNTFEGVSGDEVACDLDTDLGCP